MYGADVFSITLSAMVKEQRGRVGATSILFPDVREGKRGRHVIYPVLNNTPLVFYVKCLTVDNGQSL